MVDTAPRTHNSARKASDAQGARSGTSGSGRAGTLTPKVDVAALETQLLGDWADVRRAARELAGRPDMQKVEGLSLADQRARTFGQLSLLVENGQVHRAFPKDVGGEEDNGGNIAGFEELVAADPSLQIKSGVQWGLFGSAIVQLGTERHHQKYLPDIMSLKTPGAFAMTEIGHGSDVASAATTATYDPETQEFVINTPFKGAWKEFLGNAGNDGIAAVVFAQLISKGVNHGVHAFYVPIRDADGAFLPGVGGEDDGLKGGLNGIDNGRLHFTNVRIPRTDLLNKYGDVAEDGTYTSPISSPGRRFFTMLGTLVQGRVSLDGSAVVASKIALTIAIRYAAERRQFASGDGGGEEQVILDYQRHQRRLLPLLATTYAASFAHEVFLHKFDDVFSGATDTDADRQDLETIAAALKPLSTWHALTTLQEAREACGGAGFMTANRLTSLRADLDVYVTFEGDNNVLLQLVSKRLLTDFSKQFAHADAGVLARYAVTQAADRAYHAGLRSLGQTVRDFGSTARSVGWLQEASTQRELLTDRVEAMVAEVATALRPASKLSKKDAADLFNSQQNQLIEAARAHGELLQWEAFSDALEQTPDADTRQVLTWLRDLFGLGLIEKHAAWYLMNGRLSPQRAQAVTAYIDRLLRRIRPHAVDLVNAFGYGPEHIRAEIATGVEAERQSEAREYYRRLRESGEAPIDEKTLTKKKRP
ncbi:acyl-CoA dehydrogenase family protein [Microbacterium sp. STN6]|uniref:acyl-CoA dehydrogenase family protein n=1 Tax=Microbacterium sp. STN6 TaxID=2995588 RepID=UPI0022609ED6|nr:acyl-CoA dehydrogenase [Microbacterium sp. STN6]MCX7523017.1 acyl-CoA dehydrogenase family protein [Microbacterium sp. STN6]